MTLRQNLCSSMEDKGSCAWSRWKGEFGHRGVLNEKMGILWDSVCPVTGLPMLLGVLESRVLPYAEGASKWLRTFLVSAF